MTSKMKKNNLQHLMKLFNQLLDQNSYIIIKILKNNQIKI